MLFKVKRDRKVSQSTTGSSAARHTPLSVLAHLPTHTHLFPPPPLQVICVDPQKNPGDSTTRVDVATSEVLQAVLFDHYCK